MLSEKKKLLSFRECLLEGKCNCVHNYDTNFKCDKCIIRDLQATLDGIANALECHSVLDPLEQAKNLVEKYKSICGNLHECVNKYKLGLGGEWVDRVVVAEIDRLRATIDGLVKVIDDVLSKLREAEESWKDNGTLGSLVFYLGKMIVDLALAVEKAKEK